MLGWVLVCTLLGPEGPGLLLRSFLFGELGGGGSDSWAFVARLCVEWGWYRSYVENYTVDASILNAANVDRLRMVGFVVFSNFSQEFLRMK